MGNHAYTVLRAKEVLGVKLVLVRNPWGSAVSKWKGKWADGSKEWTQRPDMIEALEAMGHKMGDTGSFVMECE